MQTRSAALFAATVAATALAVTPAHAATITTSGVGHKILTSKNITSVKPSQQYTVTFAGATVKNQTAKYLARALPQIKAAGVRLVIGGTETVAAGKCPPRGHIHFTEVYRPLGSAGMSRALPCYDTTDKTAWGGVVQMDSEYYDGSWPLSTYMMWNSHVHEMLHILGLDHPNYDKDKDGRVEDYECVATSYGNRPLMCSPNGGYKTAANMGKLVGYDIDGVKALIANARAQGIR